MLGEQKHIVIDVLGEIHAFVVILLYLRSSMIEEWLKTVICKMFDGRTLVVDENSTDYRLSIMLEAKAPLLRVDMCFDVLVYLYRMLCLLFGTLH